MRFGACLTTCVLGGLILAASNVTRAGLFDDLANEAKKALGSAVNESIYDQRRTQQQSPPPQQYPPRDRQSKPVTQAPVPRPAPVYDRQLVKGIQQELNRLGYAAGTVDGLYGEGTRRAIEKYQSDNALGVDGKPTTLLLQNMQAQATPRFASIDKNTQANNTGHTASSSVAEKPGAAKSEKHEYADETVENYMRTAARLNPDILDVVSPVQQHRDVLGIYLRTFPEWFGFKNSYEADQMINNEFEYPRRKAEFREVILRNSSDAPLVYRRYLNDGSSFSKYDFDKQFYPFKRPVKLSAMDAQHNRQGWMLKLEKNIVIAGIAMPPDEAERIHNYMKPSSLGAARTVLIYRINSIQNDIESGGKNLHAWDISAEPLRLNFYLVKMDEYDDSVDTNIRMAPGAGLYTHGLGRSIRDRVHALHRVMNLADESGQWVLVGDAVNTLPAPAAGHFSAAMPATPATALEQNTKTSGIAENAAGSAYTLQDITTGMTDAEIGKILTADGWKPGLARQPDTENYTKIEGDKEKRLKIGYSRYGDMLKAGHIEYQLYFTTPNFDAKAIRSQIQSKYGEPVTENPSNLNYKQYPDEAAQRKDVVTACKAEILRNEPGIFEPKALSMAQQAINMNDWANQGDGYVRKHCPSTLDAFNAWIKASFGQTLNIGIEPTGLIKMTLEEKGVYHNAQREMRLAAQQETEAAPKAAMESSDF